MLTHLAGGCSFQIPFLRKPREDSNSGVNLRATLISAMWIVLVNSLNINLGISHQDPGIADRHAPPGKPSTVSGKDCLCYTSGSKPRQVAIICHSPSHGLTVANNTEMPLGPCHCHY